VSSHFVVRVPRRLAGPAVCALLLCAALPFRVHGDNEGAHGGGREGPLLSQALPDIPGKQLTAVLVNYGPGGKSPPHRHAGDVFAFVVSGSIRSENSVTGPARIYKAGEGFFEPAGSKHLVSENGSATEPAQLLAVFVADADAKLTTMDK
jgi:quercetin dioxygenase-like cupin family protein